MCIQSGEFFIDTAFTKEGYFLRLNNKGNFEKKSAKTKSAVKCSLLPVLFVCLVFVLCSGAVF